MDERQAELEIRNLVDLLNRYNHEYYILGRPSVSDLEYDRLFDDLKRLEESFPPLVRQDSPTRRTGSDLSNALPEVAHTIPVLSLDKAYAWADLQSWLDKTSNAAGAGFAVTVEEKIDGVSIVLYYEKGRLVRAITRGNGFVGNDVTANVMTIKTVPLSLTRPVDIAARGEIYLGRSDFNALNSGMENPYANPRNLAAGTLRRVKSRDVAAVPLAIFVYEGFFPASSDVALSAADAAASHTGMLRLLEELGFRVNRELGFFSDDAALLVSAEPPAAWTCGKLAELELYLETSRRRRTTLDYDIDGLVVKADDFALRERLGYTEHHPRWAVAFKFDAPEGVSRILGIDVQIGRTGRATPVARIEPVLIAGSTVSNVTLHNEEFVAGQEIAVGDLVAVSKRGDVIPAVERVVEKSETAAPFWSMPSSCPVCSGGLVKSGAHHFCVNPDCPDQLKGKLTFFVGKDQMDMSGIGEETVQFLFEHGFVRHPEELFVFDFERLIDFPGYGPKKIAAMKEAVLNCRSRPFRKVLVSLGIPEIGNKAAELLIRSGFRSIDALIEAASKEDPELFTAIGGIGPATAAVLIRELGKVELRRRIEALRSAGLHFEEETQEAVSTLPRTFEGQVWCVTGSFENFKPREKALEEIEKRGGRTVTSVTGKTTHLLAGPGGGSKLEQAKKNGARIVDEKEFLELLEKA